MAFAQFAMIIGEYRLAQMFKFNNSIVPNKVRIGWHFSSNKYTYRDVYSALKSMYVVCAKIKLYTVITYKSLHESKD